MPEAVIVAVSRSPVGRARKGSLAGMRHDDDFYTHRVLSAREAGRAAAGRVGASRSGNRDLSGDQAGLAGGSPRSLVEFGRGAGEEGLPV